MKPSDEIGAAVAKLSSLVDALPKEWGDRPWQSEECSEPDNFENCPCIVSQGVHRDFDQPQIPPIQYIADAELVVYAEYIVAMQPLVARALLGWLKSWQWADFTESGPAAEDARHALAVARAINLKNG